jgi:flagellar motor switch protein FliG
MLKPMDSDDPVAAPVDQAAMLVLAMGEDEAPRLLKALAPAQARRVGAVLTSMGRPDPAGADALQCGMAQVVGGFLEAVVEDVSGDAPAGDYLQRMFERPAGCPPTPSRLRHWLGNRRVRLHTLCRLSPRAVASHLQSLPDARQASLLACLDPATAAAVRRRLETQA